MLNRKKTDPGKYVYTGQSDQSGTEIQLFRYNKSDITEIMSLNSELIEDFLDKQSVYWLNVCGLQDPDLIASICLKFGVHSLVIQDILDINQRPKFLEYGSFNYLAIKSIVPSRHQIMSEHLSFVLGENFLISFQERKGDYFDHLRFRLRENKGIIRERSADYLLYGLLESILDNYFKTLDQIDNEVEKLNLLDQNKEPSPSVLKTIEKHKKMVHYINKSILPLKEFSQIVERKDVDFIMQQHVKYFLEIKDLCLTLEDSCEIIQSSLDSSTNLFFSIQGYRMNVIMKTLTIVATIFIPLTFITGIYGMNFENMPELKWKSGYFFLMGFLLISFLSMILYFRRKKWF